MASEEVYQLRITMRGIEPPIWRRVLVKPRITFHRLHKIIQAAFGWQDYHLYNFDFGDVVACIPDPDYLPGELYRGAKEVDARRKRVNVLLGERRECVYTYDFRDNWEHDVVMERTLAAEEGRRYPVCVDGARHRPPEDVGGISGYGEFLRAIRDPRHPEHDDYLCWADKDTGGRKFDPDYFNVNEVNRALAKVR